MYKINHALYKNLEPLTELIKWAEKYGIRKFSRPPKWGYKHKGRSLKIRDPDTLLTHAGFTTAVRITTPEKAREEAEEVAEFYELKKAKPVRVAVEDITGARTYIIPLSLFKRKRQLIAGYLPLWMCYQIPAIPNIMHSPNKLFKQIDMYIPYDHEAPTIMLIPLEDGNTMLTYIAQWLEKWPILPRIHLNRYKARLRRMIKLAGS